ncbi:DUF3027 family protein [Nocardia bhagyanarayanae]|uniref:DUF3027 family protein n=1 Tax=Nocardia bhagyanarayanae TaxID=1215925 RepID=A0A543F516_9NOCA|nr:DUF3027 domain-containing protein [Nocardia bhagyanarayanae]TQM28920.1 DUF3027 family protein [Nocardia bhagyanarayanae]
MSAVSVSEPDVRPVLAEAADLARRALLELEPSAVGAHLGVSVEDESAATHRFEATLPGYRGWQWAVVVAAPPGADHATVSESALLPGPDALVAPEFVPWEQRIRPGDLAPGDLLAPPQDDPRLVPGYVTSGDPEVDEVALEIGLGRTKVLSEEGRIEAAERWYSEYGPDTEMAKAAPSTCGKCGFYLPLAGALRAAFGVCGNAMGADGHVVHVEYGCGAHSDVVAPTGNGSPLYEAYDDAAFDVIPPEELGKGERSAAEEVADEGASAEVAAVEVAQSVPETGVAIEDGAADASAEKAPSLPETAAAPENGAVDVSAEIVRSETETVAAEADAAEMSGEVAPLVSETAADADATAGDVRAEKAPSLDAGEPGVADAGQAAVEGEATTSAVGVERAESDAVAEAAAAEAQPEAIADATAAEAVVADAVDAEKGVAPGGSDAGDGMAAESFEDSSVAQSDANAGVSAGSTVAEAAPAPVSDAPETSEPSAAESVTEAAESSPTRDLLAADVAAAEGEAEGAANDVAAGFDSKTDTGQPLASGDLAAVDDAAESETDAGPESGSSPRN